MRWPLIFALLISACSDTSSTPKFLNISGRWASAFDLHGSDGSTLTLYAIWQAVQRNANSDGSYGITNEWQLCNLTLPGPLVVPFDDAGLAQVTYKGTPATLSAPRDGARFTQPVIPMVGGAFLQSAADPLPTSAATRCDTSPDTTCVTVNQMSAEPGLRATASGLDADTVNVDFIFNVGFQGVVSLADSTLNGTLTTATLESHVIGCHLRTGVACSDAEIAALEAARPPAPWTGGSIRSHYQGDYFSCPQFLAYPEDALLGREPMSSDGGVGPASFSQIQDDVDFMGCAAGNCHEERRAQSQMHLFFHPSTAADLRLNYDAIVPWTQGAGGGRFVNEVPLPPEIRARWMNWIAAGTPFDGR